MENYRVSDLIAEFLENNNIRHVFGIVGAGDAHIFDAILRRGFTEIVCVHHEQAAVMAMGAYYRTNGELTASIVTTGAGTTNTITGLVSCWMDSIPGIIICGNEKSIYCNPTTNPLRIWGIQGFDSIAMVEKVTKYAKRVTDPLQINLELDKAKHIALEGRKGPTWLEIPMDIQGMTVDKKKQSIFQAEEKNYFQAVKDIDSLEKAVDKTLEQFQSAKRPVLWLGHGIRLADALEYIEPLLDALKCPTLLTWQGLDMIDSDNPYVFGRAGVYGQRYSNLVLQNADFVMSIGTRMAIPQIGYDLTELARDATIICVDIDKNEVEKHQSRLLHGICADAKDFLELFLKKVATKEIPVYQNWMNQCLKYKQRFPIIGPEHKDVDGYINSYPLMEMISNLVPDDEVIVTDMGTALLSGFQVLKINGNKRLFTSTGLGEMGYGLPAAIGASFALDKGSVLCLNCDGGMMMNIQELQTIAHHKLPIKVLIFNNDGYLMIKNTQKGLFEGRYSGTDKSSGVSCPDFSKIASAFEFDMHAIRTWEDAEKVLPIFLNSPGPSFCEVFMHPEQVCVPKLGIALTAEGEIVSPPLEDLSPLLDRKVLANNMIIGIHPKSEKL
ncbi:predicted thiamine pyrophosphate enzyme [Lentisphaera araneosa HTCC2155]|uniref:Predicted thiamine pyrophosphate enzyme n=1 Tax=Lentisphaera araneosa HTCC2155 TaxID=313628 RepID=A6DT17_9BACT|nr:thiamine pyrophosphate-binding protein [Lentisphaera araneosa]EDM25192.1 predicted thiamine pyrophosphate enzyme [Lentisphaera araneosa HTCC2155]